MRLRDRVAIITGAAQGIGLAYARRFLAEGARVVVADVNTDAGEEAVRELAAGADATFAAVDIADPASAEACAAATLAAYGRIDVLVNNAALYGGIDHTRQDPVYLRHVFDVNLHGAWHMARAVSPAMVTQRAGRIINQASAAAYLYQSPTAEFTGLGAFAYGQTKWGIIGLTKFLAGQLGQYNVTVNCIAPGVTLTDATRAVVPDRVVEQLARSSALRRPLQAEDLTGAAVFFAGDDAAMVSGQVLCVDGGLCMPG